jgi:hypothetical protein
MNAGTRAALVVRMTSRRISLRVSLFSVLLGAALLACDDAAETTSASSSASTAQGGDASSTASSSAASTTSSSGTGGEGGAAQATWAKALGGGDAAKVLATASGDPVFFGETSQSTDLGLGEKPRGVYVLRTARDGTPTWVLSLSSTGQLSPRVAASAAGVVVVGGFYNDQITFDDGITPPIPAPGSGGGAFLVGLDESGKILFTRTFTSSTQALGAQGLQAISISPTGKIALLAHLVGTVDFGAGPTVCDPDATYIVYYDTSNVYLTHRVAPNLSLGSVAATANGNTYVAGRFDGTVSLGSKTLQSNGGSDGVVLHLDPMLDLAEAHTFGGPGDDWAMQVVPLPAGGVAVVGSNDTPVDFGLGEIPRGLFYLEMDPATEVKICRRYAAFSASLGFTSELVLDPRGGFAVTGYAFDDVDFGTGVLAHQGHDAFYARYDASGVARDALLVGHPDPNLGPALPGLALTPSDVFLAGSLSSSATLEGVTVNVEEGSKHILHARIVR